MEIIVYILFWWGVFNSNNDQNINPGEGRYDPNPPSCGCAPEYNTLKISLLNHNMTGRSRKIKVSTTSLKWGIKRLHISIIEPFLSITLAQPGWEIRNGLAPISTISFAISSYIRLFEGHFKHCKSDNISENSTVYQGQNLCNSDPNIGKICSNFIQRLWNIIVADFENIILRRLTTREKRGWRVSVILPVPRNNVVFIFYC